MPIVDSDCENWHPKNSMSHDKENQMRRRNLNFLLYTAGTLVASVILAAANPLFGMPANTSENLPPAELVRLTVAHELAAAEHASVKHRFRSRRETGHGAQTKIYVETRDVMLGMVVAYNDQPTSAEQLQAEKSRLQHLIKDPAQLRPAARGRRAAFHGGHDSRRCGTRRRRRCGRLPSPGPAARRAWRGRTRTRNRSRRRSARRRS